jgi:hypothetical protein
LAKVTKPPPPGPLTVMSFAAIDSDRTSAAWSPYGRTTFACALPLSERLFGVNAPLAGSTEVTTPAARNPRPAGERALASRGLRRD